MPSPLFLLPYRTSTSPHTMMLSKLFHATTTLLFLLILLSNPPTSVSWDTTTPPECPYPCLPPPPSVTDSPPTPPSTSEYGNYPPPPPPPPPYIDFPVPPPPNPIVPWFPWYYNAPPSSSAACSGFSFVFVLVDIVFCCWIPSLCLPTKFELFVWEWVDLPLVFSLHLQWSLDKVLR